MGSGYVLEARDRVIVSKPVLPSGCSSCEYAIECAEPVRESFIEVKNLPGVYIADQNKLSFDAEVIHSEPHLSVINNYDIVSRLLKQVLDYCNNGALDVYENGQYKGMYCRANQEIY